MLDKAGALLYINRGLVIEKLQRFSATRKLVSVSRDSQSVHGNHKQKLTHKTVVAYCTLIPLPD